MLLDMSVPPTTKNVVFHSKAPQADIIYLSLSLYTAYALADILGRSAQRLLVSDRKSKGTERFKKR